MTKVPVQLTNEIFSYNKKIQPTNQSRNLSGLNSSQFKKYINSFMPLTTDCHPKHGKQTFLKPNLDSCFLNGTLTKQKV